MEEEEEEDAAGGGRWRRRMLLNVPGCRAQSAVCDSHGDKPSCELRQRNARRRRAQHRSTARDFSPTQDAGCSG